MRKGVKLVLITAALAVFLAAGLFAHNRHGISLTAGGEQNRQNGQATAEYRRITPEKANEMMAGGSRYILLDVRTQVEFDEGHIDGAILIPDTDIALRADRELDDKDAAILIYCRSGRRSELAARELVRLGYTNVYDFGGIIDWPYEVVK